MSYVIQNFAKNNHHVVITPRFKTFVTIKWLNFFIFFFKSSYVYKKNIKFKNLYLFFFKRGLHVFFYSSLKNLSGNYTNKLTSTASYWSFKIVNDFWNFNNIINLPVKFHSTYFYNLYFLSIKTINAKLTKTYFKYIYFFFLFFLSDIWLQFAINLKFYLNFFFVRSNYKIYKFYSGYFLRIYNF